MHVSLALPYDEPSGWAVGEAQICCLRCNIPVSLFQKHQSHPTAKLSEIYGEPFWIFITLAAHCLYRCATFSLRLFEKGKTGHKDLSCYLLPSMGDRWRWKASCWHSEQLFHVVPRAGTWKSLLACAACQARCSNIQLKTMGESFFCFSFSLLSKAHSYFSKMRMN